MSVPPIKKSWWVCDGLLAGPSPVQPESRARLDKLLAYGMNSFVDLRDTKEEIDGFPEVRYDSLLPSGVEYKNFPILDGQAPARDEDTDRIVRYICERMESGKKVYVHCHGGHGRTGTIVAAFLVRGGFPPAGSILHINILRKAACAELSDILSPQTDIQMGAIHSYGRFLQKA